MPPCTRLTPAPVCELAIVDGLDVEVWPLDAALKLLPPVPLLLCGIVHLVQEETKLWTGDNFGAGSYAELLAESRPGLLDHSRKHSQRAMPAANVDLS